MGGVTELGWRRLKGKFTVPFRRPKVQNIAAFKKFKMTGKAWEEGGNPALPPGSCDISDCKHTVSALEEYLHVLTHLFPSLHLIISAARDTYTASSAEQIENSP